jgi:hypothetical protein
MLLYGPFWHRFGVEWKTRGTELVKGYSCKSRVSGYTSFKSVGLIGRAVGQSKTLDVALYVTIWAILA